MFFLTLPIQTIGRGYKTEQLNIIIYNITVLQGIDLNFIGKNLLFMLAETPDYN